MPFKSEKQRKWMWAKDPEMAKKWEKEESLTTESGILYRAGVKKYGKEGMKKIQSAAGKRKSHAEIGAIKDKYEKDKKESVSEKAERDYKDEYKKFQSSDKSKKYRAELNQYNRKKGTYGNGDGKDASHKGGKIAGFEAESKNRGRAEKSRLKKEAKTVSIDGEQLMNFLMKRFKYSKKQAIATMKKHKMDTSFLKKESPDFNPMIDTILDDVIDEYQTTKNEGKFGKFDTGAGFKGNGMTIYDRNQEKSGDFKNIAHIGEDGKITIYDKNVKKETKLMQSLNKISQEFKKTFKESVNETVYQFKKYTNTQMDKLDALLSRAGYKGKPDFNKMTWTTKDKNSKIEKIIKSKGGKKIKESVNEKMDPEQYHKYMQYVFDTQFKTPEEKKMKKSIVKKINVGQKKKGLPVFKESTNEGKLSEDYKNSEWEVYVADEAYGKEKIVKKAKSKRAAVILYNKLINSDKYAEVGMRVVKESVNEGQKREASNIINKFDQAYIKFSKEIRDIIKMVNRSTNEKTDGKIIDKAYSKHLIPLDKLMQSWSRGQQDNPNIKESDLGLTYKKGKTVKVKHKTSGKRLVVVDKPAVRKEYEKIGYFAESVDEMKKLFQITAVKKAIAIAKKMKGNMTGAVKKIEKMNRGLSDEPDVAAALKKANESVNEINGVDLAKKVLKDKQHEKGIDLQTANLIVTIDKAYDKNPSLQKKFRAIPLAKMKKLISQYSK